MILVKKMKAAILVEQNKPLIVDEVLLPEKLDIGQVLVKVYCSGICGSQLGEILGVKGPDKFLPHLLGHEASGEVVDIGPGVSKVSPGQKVVMHWKEGSGIRSKPPIYSWRGEALNAGLITTFNEYAIISENRTTLLPPDCDMQTGALFGCAITTGFGVVENIARPKIGSSVVVYGAGGVGLNIVQAASFSGAYPIIAVDIHQGRLELARTLGATHAFDGKLHNIQKEIQNIIGNSGLDIFIDNTGNMDIVAMGYNLVNGAGKVILVGVPKAGDDLTIHSLPLHFGKSVSGTHGGNGNPDEDIPRYAKYFLNKGINFESIISNVYSLADINSAVEDMKNGKSNGRCLIYMNEL